MRFIETVLRIVIDLVCLPVTILRYAREDWRIYHGYYSFEKPPKAKPSEAEREARDYWLIVLLGGVVIAGLLGSAIFGSPIG